MKKLLFNLNVTVSHATSAKDTVDFIEQINDELIQRGYGVVEVSTGARSSPAPRVVQGPLERHWCAEKGVRGVRRTDGRSSEAQAEYNLRHYLGYTDEEIQEVLRNAPSVEYTPATENLISEQSGVVHEDSEDEAEVDEASLM